MTCDRCGKETSVHILSMFNEQDICIDCKELSASVRTTRTQWRRMRTQSEAATSTSEASASACCQKGRSHETGLD